MTRGSAVVRRWSGLAALGAAIDRCIVRSLHERSGFLGDVRLTVFAGLPHHNFTSRKLLGLVAKAPIEKTA